MKFEEALTKLRENKKIRHPNMERDEYFVGCYISLNAKIFGLPEEDFEEAKARGLSICKIKNNTVHDDMYNQLKFDEYVDLLEKYPFLREKLSYPTINLSWVMSEDWELVE